jgi:hypothetical protein
MIKLKIKTPKFWGVKSLVRELPQSWAEIECDAKRLNIYGRIILNSDDDSLFSILKDLLCLPKFVFVNIQNNDLVVMLDCLAWMKEDVGVRSLIPNFTHQGVVYYFPKNDFDIGSAFEYALADEYYTAYAEDTSDIDALYLLASALMRINPNESNSSKAIVESRLDIFKELPDEIIIMALRYFEALRKEVFELGNSVNLFDAPNQGEEKSDDTIEFGWWTGYRFIAKSQVFGNFKGVCEALFWDVFKYLIEEKQRENYARKTSPLPPQ